MLEPNAEVVDERFQAFMAIDGLAYDEKASAMLTVAVGLEHIHNQLDELTVLFKDFYDFYTTHQE